MSASPLTTALATLLARNGGTVQATATDLQATLAADLPDDLAALDASRFSAALRAAVPTLAAAGIDVEPPGNGGRNGRIWTLRRADTAGGMAVPSANPPAIPEVPMPTTAASLPAQIGAARTALHRALLAGQDSRPARAALEALEDRQARHAAQEAAAAAAVQRQRQAAIDTRAADLATTAAASLAATMAALQPPPAPTCRTD